MNTIAQIGLFMAVSGFFVVYVLYAVSSRGRYGGFRISNRALMLPWKMAWSGVAILAIIAIFR